MTTFNLIAQHYCQYTKIVIYIFRAYNMTYLVKLVTSLVLIFGLVTLSSAATVYSASDGFKVYQSDTDETTEEGEEKKKEGEEEEEPDC